MKNGYVSFDILFQFCHLKAVFLDKTKHTFNYNIGNNLNILIMINMTLNADY